MDWTKWVLVLGGLGALVVWFAIQRSKAKRLEQALSYMFERDEHFQELFGFMPMESAVNDYNQKVVDLKLEEMVKHHQMVEGSQWDERFAEGVELASHYGFQIRGTGTMADYRTNS